MVDTTNNGSDKNVTGMRRLILRIGSIGPLGHMPASGTVTVGVIGIPLYWLLAGTNPSAYVTIVIAFALASVWVHQLGDRWLEVKDSRQLVWDELAGYFVAVAFLPFTWQLAVASFVLERALDIIKVPPARQIEKNWPGGWGVVGDDIVAGAYTFFILHLAATLIPQHLGLAAPP